MRIAYADPPYPGQAARWYDDQPDYAGEVAHAELVGHLVEQYDGWALSTSAAALAGVVRLCPTDVRIAIWYRPNSEPPGNRGHWWWTFEAIIVQPARPPSVQTKDHLTYHKEQGFLGSVIPGQKPRPVCWWIFDLLGAEPDDELDDLYPGSGAVGRAWEGWRNQLRLAV